MCSHPCDFFECLNAESGSPLKQNCNSGGVLGQLSIIDGTRNSSSSLAPVRISSSPAGACAAPSIGQTIAKMRRHSPASAGFGGTKNGANATQFCQKIWGMSPGHDDIFGPQSGFQNARGSILGAANILSAVPLPYGRKGRNMSPALPRRDNSREVNRESVVQDRKGHVLRRVLGCGPCDGPIHVIGSILTCKSETKEYADYQRSNNS
jgi:hypothetical protein